jgi:hypothetical protein
MNIVQLLVQWSPSAFSTTALVVMVTREAEVEMKAELRTSCPRKSLTHSELCISLRPLEIQSVVILLQACLPSLRMVDPHRMVDAVP